MVKVAILGGGLTGVTLARLLCGRSHDVVVLEGEDRCGGLCRTRVENGFTFDTGGSHVIFSRDTEVLKFLIDLLGTNTIRRRRKTKILFRDRYVKYPFENGLYQLEREDCFRCLFEYIRSYIAAEKGELPAPKNFREWMYFTFGAGITDLYLLPYNEKIWKFPPERMSAHWVEGRIPRPPPEDIIKSAIGIETEGYTHQLFFSYPRRGGINALIEAMVAPVRDRIRCNFRVRSIERVEGGFILSDGKERIFADRCISTIPLHALISSCHNVPDRVRNACMDLKFNSLYSVLVGIEGEVPPYSWVYTHERGRGLFNRISFPSNYSPEAAPAGCSSILAEITFRCGDEIDRMSEEAIVSHVVDGLHGMGLIDDPSRIVHTSISRQEYAYVIYDLDYQKNIAIVREWCRTQGIDLVGRFSQFEYLNMDGCVRSAIDFVKGFP
ncbi:MAG: FAD-dependent oxidoreductase [Methanomicrobiales archaeon]|nr:FAD-dependent oxidoreductase [Methanomicrobiales archaeon]